MIKWSVLIDGIGLRVVMSKDIDGAYLAAMKEYGCKIEDILAVFCHAPAARVGVNFEKKIQPNAGVS